MVLALAARHCVALEIEVGKHVTDEHQLQAYAKPTTTSPSSLGELAEDGRGVALLLHASLGHEPGDSLSAHARQLRQLVRHATQAGSQSHRQSGRGFIDGPNPISIAYWSDRTFPFPIALKNSVDKCCGAIPKWLSMREHVSHRIAVFVIRPGYP